MLTLGKIPPFICAWEGFQLQILNEVQGILDLFEIFECLQILDLQSVEKVTRAFRFVFDFSENLYVEFPGGGGGGQRYSHDFPRAAVAAFGGSQNCALPLGKKLKR